MDIQVRKLTPEQAEKLRADYERSQQKCTSSVRYDLTPEQQEKHQKDLAEGIVPF